MAYAILFRFAKASAAPYGTTRKPGHRPLAEQLPEGTIARLENPGHGIRYLQ